MFKVTQLFFNFEFKLKKKLSLSSGNFSLSVYMGIYIKDTTIKIHI